LDCLFYTFFVIISLAFYPFGLTFAAFVMFYPCFLISEKTRKMGILILEFSGFVFVMFFFKFFVILMFLPLIFYNYIRTFKKISDGIITPENEFMINFYVLFEDYKYYGSTLMNIINYINNNNRENNSE